ncbi:ankyrin [Acephala macrosclerotiorum]|nr:ankyrin [Acephala macrosclerotiorum]
MPDEARTPLLHLHLASFWDGRPLESPSEPQSAQEQDKSNECARIICREEIQGQCPSEKCETREIMDPFSIVGTSIALAATTATAASSLKLLHSDYRDAGKDRLHFQQQKEHLQLNLSLANGILQDVPSLKSSLADLEAALPSQPCLGKRRDKLRWALGRKRKAQDEIGRWKDVQSSTSVTLLLKAHDKLRELTEIKEALNEHFSEQDQKLAFYDSRMNRLELSEQLFEAYMRKQELRVLYERSPSDLKRRTSASIYNLILSLGIVLRLIVSVDDSQTMYRVMVQWPLFYGMVLVWHMSISRGLPTGRMHILRPRTEIPANSAIITACLNNDIECIKKLFSSSQAHVSDVTPDNLTLLRFAIRGGHYEVVKLLLDNGADPNQTFGKYDTSPLNNAFLNGRVDLIRLLLRAKADLHHVNTRTWTSLYYLWDPERPHHSTTSEILGLCNDEHYEFWNFRDLAGWAPINRVAAFGHAVHIKKLFNMKVIKRDAKPLTVAGWSPVQCAVRFGNLSTFEYLVKETLARFDTFVDLEDKNGWSLLHLAAASGSEELITDLLLYGLSPDALSDRSTLCLPEELDNRALTPRQIAEHYGHVKQYDNALRAAGNWGHKNPNEVNGNNLLRELR